MTNPEFFANSPEEVGIDPAKLEDLFQRAEREVAEGLLPSAQIAVAREGKLAGMRTVGRVTRQGVEGPATDDTLYCVFSATKAITSAAAWLLIQEGRLKTDELVADIIPEFGTHGKEVIRVEQLFTHTSGFPHAPFPPREWNDPEKTLQRFSAWRLNWEPGTRFEYHPSSSMWVIAAIVARRSGVEFREFVRKRIAEPLGLDDLWVGLPPEQQPRLADVVHVGEEMTAEDYEKLGFSAPPETEVTEDTIETFNEPLVREGGVPGGGGTMTAAELALFYQALLHGGSRGGAQVWSPETLRTALEVRSGELVDPMVGKRANRALGLVIAGDSERNFRNFGHTNSPAAFGHGGAGGQLAWADPQTGISLGYVTNGHDRNMMRMGRRGVGISSRAASVKLESA